MSLIRPCLFDFSCSTRPALFWWLRAFLSRPWDSRDMPVVSSRSLSTIAITWGTYGLIDPLGSGATLSVRDRTLTTPPMRRTEEHTSELQSLMSISYDGFSLKKKTNHT